MAQLHRVVKGVCDGCNNQNGLWRNDDIAFHLFCEGLGTAKRNADVIGSVKRNADVIGSAKWSVIFVSFFLNVMIDVCVWNVNGVTFVVVTIAGFFWSVIENAPFFIFYKTN
jgi:hypothetical protein